MGPSKFMCKSDPLFTFIYICQSYIRGRMEWTEYILPTRPTCNVILTYVNDPMDVTHSECNLRVIEWPYLGNKLTCSKSDGGFDPICVLHSLTYLF